MPVLNPVTPTTVSSGGSGSGSGELSFAAEGPVRTVGGCAAFPADHFMNATNVDRLAVHARSADWIRFLGGSATTLKAPSDRIWQGSRAGIPINVVDSREIGKSSVLLNTAQTTKNYHGKYPIPSNPRVQGDPTPAWDRHLLMVDVADCTAYELNGYEILAIHLFGTHAARSGVRYPLDAIDVPAKTTNAANTPMIGQFLMVDEVDAGRVDHPVAFCTNAIGTYHTWPAQMGDGRIDDPHAIPMGAWLRLRSDVDPTRFTGQARPVVDALRRHGMILTDTCAHDLSMLGENSDRWVNSEMDQLRTLRASDFEAVDVSPMKVADDSFRIN